MYLSIIINLTMEREINLAKNVKDRETCYM